MHAPEPLLGGYEMTEMTAILARACALAGLDDTDAQLLRGHTNVVVRLADAPVVVKIARKGTRAERVHNTVRFVRWLMAQGFPTVPLHPTEQPLLVQNVVPEPALVTLWTYLPQPELPVPAAAIAPALRWLHSLPQPPVRLQPVDHIRAIRSSLAVTDTLPAATLLRLSERADHLEEQLERVVFELLPATVQGDAQHRNALHHRNAAVLCDWDTVAHGQPEWDLISMEIHCRRFGFPQQHHTAFVRRYGYDITRSPGYRVLREVRELRMITTNARKAADAPGTLAEVTRRIHALHSGHEDLAWNIL
ncbi:phosphotransferase [Streptomyces sp. NPDC049881]|uniref:phosphotransferase family protein n=1 Tax=Streptomyces sp. NPDC049881 TaxID=3155778 RepID=UPI00343F7964